MYKAFLLLCPALMIILTTACNARLEYKKLESKEIIEKSPSIWKILLTYPMSMYKAYYISMKHYAELLNSEILLRKAKRYILVSKLLTYCMVMMFVGIFILSIQFIMSVEMEIRIMDETFIVLGSIICLASILLATIIALIQRSYYFGFDKELAKEIDNLGI